MKYLVLLLGLILTSLGIYTVHLTRNLAIEQENNRQLHNAIDRQQAAIQELETNYSKVLEITREVSRKVTQREQARMLVIDRIQVTKNAQEQEKNINTIKKEYNKCVTQISSGSVLDSCASFLAPVKQ